VDALGNGLPLRPPGLWADSPQLPGLLAVSPIVPGAVVADKAYGNNAVFGAVVRGRCQPVIPPKRTCPVPHLLYTDRNKVERFFCSLKEARGFATCCYEKTAIPFSAVAQLLSALYWLR
jgi:transposase